MSVTLGAKTDDRHLAAFEQAKICVFVVENFHFNLL